MGRKSLNNGAVPDCLETAAKGPIIPSWLRGGERQRVPIRQLPERAQIDAPRTEQLIV